MEDVLELLNGCGVTTPIQLRRVVLCNPKFLHLRAGRNLKSKLNFLRTFMTEDDISKLVMNNARIFNSAEDKLKSAISLLQRLGVERKELSHLVAKQPLLLTSTEEQVIESFKQAENLGFKKGSKLFAAAMRALFLSGKDKLEQKLYYLSSLGFSKEQVSRLCCREPFILALSEEKLKRNADFLVNSMALPLADVAKYPNLFSNSLEKRIIPRYRVIEALKPMQVQEFKRRICLGDIAFLTEKTFLEKYVNKNAESSYLLDIYNGGKARKLIIDKETGSECLSIKGIQEISESLSGPST